MSIKKTNNKMIYTIFFILFTILWFLCFWRCKYGFPSDDEAFYLAIPYHLCQGDSLIVNEWNLAQLFSFLLYPLVKLYLTIVGNTTGIILGFRYIFTLIWGFIAFFLFLRLKRYSPIGAGIAAYSFLLFSRCGVPALSYNTLGIANFLITLILLCANSKHSKVKFSIAGLFFAAAVLCNPYLVIIYCIFSLVMLISLLFKINDSGEIFKSWLFLTLGIATLAIIFVLFLLSRTTIAQILAAVPFMFANSLGFNSSLYEKLTSIYWAFMYSGGFFTFYSIIATAISSFLALVCPKFRKIGFILVLICYIASLHGILLNWGIPDALMFPVILLGGYCGIAFSRSNANIRRLFFYIWLPGFIYAFLFFFSSDTMFSGFSAGCTVPAVASYVIIILALMEILANSSLKIINILISSFLACVICFQIFIQLKNKCEFQLSGSFATLSSNFGLSVSEAGPNAGLYSSSSSLENYNTLLSDTEKMRNEYNAEQVCYITISPIAFLTGPERMGSFSAWLTGIHAYPNHTLKSLSNYYSLNPDRIPDTVFIHKNNYYEMPEETCELITNWFVESFDYEVKKLPSGNAIIYSPAKQQFFLK